MTTSTAEFFIRLNAGQADEALSRTRAATLTLGGGLERLDRASTAAAKGIGAMTPALGALSRSSSEVLRGIGDISGLIGPGGGLAIGLTVAVAGAMKLHQAWDEYSANAKIAKEATDAIVPSLNRMTDNALKPGADAIVRMRRELAELGTTLSQRDREAASATVEQLERQRANLTKRGAELGGTGRAALRNADGSFADQSTEAQVLRNIAERARALDAALVQARSQYDSIVVAEMRLDKAKAEQEERNKKDRAPTGGGASAAAKAAEQAEIDAWNTKVAIEKAERDKQRARVKQEQDEILTMYEARAAAREEREAEHTRFLAEQERERTAAAKAALAERVRAEAEAQREKEAIIRSTTDTVLGITVGAAQLGTAAMVDGQKNALEQIGVYLMAQAGTALIGGGIKLGGEAVVSALTPGLQPLAAAQALGSAALITTGVGLGGASQYLGKLSAIGISAPKERGGGDLGRAPGVGTGSRGFGNASSGGGAAGGRTVTIVNVYGVSGPQAEDRARMTWRDLQLADRRGMSR